MNILRSSKENIIEESRKIPYYSITILAIIILGCIFANIIMPYDPTYMNLAQISQSPRVNHLFGTDTLGRDIFSMIWYGGRISLFIGILATVISTTIAIVYGCISGLMGKHIDDAMMRFTEIVLSIPSILIVIFIQAIIGQSNAVSIAFSIGITSWMNISKIVRSEVRQIRNSEYILAARSMGGGFFYILRKHLLPNFISSIMFMVVTNIGYAIGTEATLSFLGIGLPVEIISWGSLMALSQKALLSNFWWIILIPGIFLITTLVCITNIGNYIRKKNNREFSNL
ncbi:ABC transporter permease [Anaerovorax odorimutans]|uniref:ABC transporter permease n=1 Tax=Anaerovorax odorimutans TaxID=109327 RepID=UPI0004285875|nr:ABC transporter permease [Anaerovorax odorimutans]